MSKLTILFIVVLLTSTTYCTSVTGAFKQVRNALTNFRQSIVNEQVDEGKRYNKEKKWCKKVISEAKIEVAKRQKEVDDIKAHIKYLKNARKEAIKDKKTRTERIKTNIANLKKFKKERCDANLLFVKALREHMEAIKVMKLLKRDIIEFFNKKRKEER